MWPAGILSQSNNKAVRILRAALARPKEALRQQHIEKERKQAEDNAEHSRVGSYLFNETLNPGLFAFRYVNHNTTDPPNLSTDQQREWITAPGHNITKRHFTEAEAEWMKYAIADEMKRANKTPETMRSRRALWDALKARGIVTYETRANAQQAAYHIPHTAAEKALVKKAMNEMDVFEEKWDAIRGEKERNRAIAHIASIVKNMGRTNMGRTLFERHYKPGGILAEVARKRFERGSRDPAVKPENMLTYRTAVPNPALPNEVGHRKLVDELVKYEAGRQREVTRMSNNAGPSQQPRKRQRTA